MYVVKRTSTVGQRPDLELGCNVDCIPLVQRRAGKLSVMRSAVEAKCCNYHISDFFINFKTGIDVTTQ
jgi:hypothetical protein